MSVFGGEYLTECDDEEMGGVCRLSSSEVGISLFEDSKSLIMTIL